MERHNALADAPTDYEAEFTEGACYREKTGFADDMRHKWDQFEKSLKTEARLFNKVAEHTLAAVFADVATHMTGDGRPLVKAGGQETQFPAFYRARVFTKRGWEQALREPEKEIGPPPADHATAGRANSRNISVFYGATDRNVALSEVRPPVGSHAVVARFDVVRPIRLLDIGAMEALYVQPSVFDPVSSEAGAVRIFGAYHGSHEGACYARR